MESKINQLPIAFTLYYPTAAQIESYLGFMAMLSIAFAIFRLATSISGRYRSGSDVSFILEMIIISNPAGTLIAVVADKFATRNGLDNWVWLAVFSATPVILMIPFIL